MLSSGGSQAVIEWLSLSTSRRFWVRKKESGRKRDRTPFRDQGYQENFLIVLCLVQQIGRPIRWMNEEPWMK